MIRAITLIPGSGEADGLTYNERVSRDRGLHVLLQDHSGEKLPSRRRFILRAYREIVSKYISFGKIEHPLPLAVNLVRYMEELAKDVESRIEDFRGFGFYVLFQDRDVCYLLASPANSVQVRLGGRFEALSSDDVPGVNQLPVDRVSSQRELFPRNLCDFLKLYKIQIPPSGNLDLVLGASGEEVSGLMEAVEREATAANANGTANLPLDSISHKMLYIRIAGVKPARAVVGEFDKKKTSKRSVEKAGTFAFTVVFALIFVTLGAIWLNERLSGEGAGVAPATEGALQRSSIAEPMAVLEEETERGGAVAEPTPTVPESSVEADEVLPHIRFATAWEKSYTEPVTSSPLIVGDKVIFGGRDGRLYALDKRDGELIWRYVAEDGIGASPDFSNDRVIAADYRGNVFAVGLDNGKRLWNNKLPQKVIASPVVAGGEVLVGCYDGKAYALSVETGRVLWKVETGGRIRGSPAYGGGQFYIPSYDNKIYAVSAGTGRVRWTYQLRGIVSSSPAADSNQVVIGGENGGIYSIDAKTGRLRWKFDTTAAVKSFVRLIDGRVYAGSNDKALYCLDDENGRLIWKYTTGDVVLSRPAVTGGYVIITSYDNNVYCLDTETGDMLDRFDSNGPVFSSPAVDGDQVYFGNNNNKFFSLTYLHKGTS